MMKYVPDVTFKTFAVNGKSSGDYPSKWKDLTTDEIFKGKKIVLFALPGAFTPVCSTKHLPVYEKRYDEIKKLGVDEVYCLSVNDPYVMHNWFKHLGIKKVKPIPDGNAEFTKAVGMLVKKENLGLGARSWRYSAYLENGEFKKVFIEPGQTENCEEDPLEISDAKNMVKYLKSM